MPPDQGNAVERRRRKASGLRLRAMAAELPKEELT
jgi:hypothetical protein